VRPGRISIHQSLSRGFISVAFYQYLVELRDIPAHSYLTILDYDSDLGCFFDLQFLFDHVTTEQIPNIFVIDLNIRAPDKYFLGML
jgi:hypothetical protein